jgi:hypothetical protein
MRRRKPKGPPFSINLKPIRRQNMKIIPIIITSLVLAGKIQANDTYPILQLQDGTIYTNAEVSSVTATAATVFYDGGGKKIALTNFPPDLQRKYHFDPAGAATTSVAEAKAKDSGQACVQKALQQQAVLFNPTGPPFTVRIVKRDILGRWLVKMGGGRRQGGQQIVLIPNLPQNIEQFLIQLNSARDDLKPMPYRNWGGICEVTC